MNSDEMLNQSVPEDFRAPIESDLRVPGIDENPVTAVADFLKKETGNEDVELPDARASFQAGGQGRGAEPLQQVDPAQQAAVLQTQIDLLKLRPEERYRERLKQFDISLEEARRIIDCVVVQLKPYAERVSLSPTTSCELRTRTQADQDRLNEVIETMAPQYRQTIESEITRQNLVSSLVRYGDMKFPRESVEDTANVIKWVTAIPQPTFVLLSKKLYEFDRKIDLVFQDGYLENF